MHVHRYRGAAIAMMLALVAALLSATPSLAASDCPSGQSEFRIDNRPSNGTYGDGTLSVTISNADEDSFQWSSNIEVESVMVKAGTTLKENPGGTSGTATSAENPNNDQRYGISHVSFCYSSNNTSGGGGGGGEEEDCPEDGSNDNGNGNGKKMNDEDCEEEEEDCPEAGSNGNGSGNGKKMSDEDCEEEEEDEEEDDSELDDDVAGGVDQRPSRPEVVEVPEPRVRGVRVRAATGPAVVAAPEVRSSHRRNRQEEAEVLPRTGETVVPWIVLGLGLIASGTLFWRRRHQS